ncbi:MAG: YlxR family protein [Chloroflexota bacterium]
MPAQHDAAPQGVPAHKFPKRTCVACRTERQKRDFVRVVRAPDGTMTIDPTGRANGRGAYLCADGSCWPDALKKKSIDRALGVEMPPAVRVQLEEGVGHGS